MHVDDEEGGFHLDWGEVWWADLGRGAELFAIAFQQCTREFSGDETELVLIIGMRISKAGLITDRIIV